MALLYLAAILGAIVDWQYCRHGGKRPSRNDYRYLLYGIVLIIVAVVALGLMGADAGALGDLAGLLTIVVFVLWEFDRFRVRRAHPLPKRPS